MNDQMNELMNVTVSHIELRVWDAHIVQYYPPTKCLCFVVNSRYFSDTMYMFCFIKLNYIKYYLFCIYYPLLYL